MMMRILLFTTLLFPLPYAFSQVVNDSLLPIMEAELNREKAEFKNLTDPPYFIAFQVLASDAAVISASFGSLTNSEHFNTRKMTADVRIGNYSFDNTHVSETSDEFYMPYFGRLSQASLPQADSVEAIRFIMWDLSRTRYQTALTAYKIAKGKTPETKAIPDFSREEISVEVEPMPIRLTDLIDTKQWEQKVRNFSKIFLSSPEIIQGYATLQAAVERHYFISTEGTKLATNRTLLFMSVSASILAIDGDVLPLHKTYFAFDPAGLPTDETIIADINKMVEKLKALRSAPVVDPYTGPAILYAPAAAVFFHEIFGHRVEGHRLKDRNDGQTFKEKIGQNVLLKTLSVQFDPTLTSFEGKPLNGSYRFDDEGIRSRKVTVVDRGILKGFLMSRAPLNDQSHSNGHGRGVLYSSPVTRQSNLLVENSKPVSMKDLRKLLISECKKQDKAYGYLFADVMGGFTMTNRMIPNAFNIFPTEVFRVYVDGRPDELVRGVDLIGTPLAMFAEIAAADNDRNVFTGFCGAESGFIPVTSISPSLFVKRIETQKKPTATIVPPVLPRPGSN